MAAQMLMDNTDLNLIHAAQQNNPEALEALLAQHMPLLRVLASRFHASGTLYHELIQAGCIGFIQAVRHYQTDLPAKLTTYAFPWILGEMRQALRSACPQALLSLDACLYHEEEGCLGDLLGCEGIDLHRLDLRLAMEHLQEDEQTLLYLRFFRDKTQKETALLLKKSQSQICKLERKVLDHLHAQLT